MYRALIVCNSRFPNDAGKLGELYGPKADGVLLRDALTDHDTGMFEKTDVQILNEEGSPEVSRAIDDFFSRAEADDTLLFYYSGHGRSRDQQLFLCTRNTVVDRLHSTSISESTLNGIVSSSFAQVKILILDCCHSGMLKGTDFAEGLFGTGRYVIAAASATDRASDSAHRGAPSPFTRMFAEALLSKAEDRNGDDIVDLDDVYEYLESVPFEGPRPQRKFDGSGAIPIARRINKLSHNKTRSASLLVADNMLPDDSGSLLDAKTSHSYLDTLIPSASFSSDRVADFRARLRDDISESMPKQLTATEFLQRAGLLRQGSITRAGLLLFGDNPTAIMPNAMVQCVRFHGATKTDPLESMDLQGTVPELIVQARDFVANLARLGETPTTEGAYAETAYSYPMIAVREIIANAVVHRDYEAQESCVQIHVFSDRIEVMSPGEWGGTPTVIGRESRLGELERPSQRRNFRLAQTLTWSKLVEGVGAGVPRAIADCQTVGASEPMVMRNDRMIVVTIFPRPQGAYSDEIDKVRSWPVYRRIAEDLRERIESGELRPGSIINDTDLREEYEASRKTTRDAVKLLANMGLIETRPGTGIVVTNNTVPFVIAFNTGSCVDSEGSAYSSEVTAADRRPHVSAPRVEVLSVSDQLASELQIEYGSTVVSRQEQRFIDGTPYSLQTSFYPMVLVESGASSLLQAEHITVGAVRYLEEIGIKEVRSREVITARAPNDDEVAFFMIPEDGSVVVIEARRTAFDEAGNPVRITATIYPADRNEFVLSGGKNAGQA